MNTFQDLGLNEDLLQAITDMGFTKPSEVQDKAIPILLEQDVDLVALAQQEQVKLLLLDFQCYKKLTLTAEPLKV